MACLKDSMVLVTKLREITLLIPFRGEVPKPDLAVIRQKAHELDCCASCLDGSNIVCSEKVREA